MNFIALARYFWSFFWLYFAISFVLAIVSIKTGFHPPMIVSLVVMLVPVAYAIRRFVIENQRVLTKPERLNFATGIMLTQLAYFVIFIMLVSPMLTTMSMGLGGPDSILPLIATLVKVFPIAFFLMFLSITVIPWLVAYFASSVIANYFIRRLATGPT
jgi:hypothetical protein